MMDITSDVTNIRANNSDDAISVLYADSPISATTSDLKNCCKYKYLVLNNE